MHFRLLGPLEASNGDGSLPLGGPKQRTVLAHLLLQANRVVTSERLIDALWGEEPPDTARNTLQTYVRHLRRTLGADRIVHRSAGYVFEARTDELDLLRFDALVEEARRLSSSDLPGAASTLREALDLWRGPALDDLTEQPSLRSDIARLEEIRMVATEDRIAADLSLGAHRELIPELEALVARHPFRERLWGQLMLALYRSGRQGDALAAYQRAREVLTEELGIDPSSELQRLQDQILRQDTALAVAGEPLRGYRLLTRIGAGAHGVVWLASQPHLAREVAIKAIAPAFANDPEFVRRFEAEAQTVARLEDPYIVPLYDFWREPDGAYLVMRYLRGGNAEDLVKKGPLDTDAAARLIEQVGQGLSTAHRQGVIHRDVKPSNVLLDDQGNAYLSDFGIARDLALPAGGPTDLRSVPYASPEVVRGEAASAASDVYSLGVLLYRILAGPGGTSRPGRAPFGTDGDGGLPSVRDVRPDLPDSVDRILRIAMAPDPADRYDDPAELAAAFQRVLRRTEAVPPPTVGEVRNPYKGLRPFSEADAEDFFGREPATEQLLSLLAEPGPGFVAVVGPSGSGKSSLVGAGLVSALRRGAVPGSERWFVVTMAPGRRPFDELEAALTRIAPSRPAGLLEELTGDEAGLVRAAAAILPPDGSELLLVIDQFEELFTLTPDEDVRSRFLAALVATATDPRSRVRTVITLRADFFDRPLRYPGFGDLLALRTQPVPPLSTEELERAVAGPAERVGVSLEPRLVAEILADVAHQPGALPLLQFALTEGFDRRRGGGVLTLDGYREIGGVSGAVVGRAEEVLAGLDEAGKGAARQLFLRLVTLGEEGSEDTRRRVLRAELDAMEGDRDAVGAAVDAFGEARLLSFDRDPETRGPTVEVAHEALLGAWARLRGWIESAREDMRMHRRLAGPAAEWEAASGDASFLLRGARLDQFEGWAAASGLALTGPERAFLEASLAARETEGTEREQRRRREAALERRSSVRLRALVAVLAAATLVASSLTVVAVNRSREAERQRAVAVLGVARERAGRLTSAAVAQLDNDPELSLVLSLHAVELVRTIGEPVPSDTVEALHWGIQELGVPYPMRDGPVLEENGPTGTRGLFDMPVSDLANLARASTDRTLPTNQCEQFFESRTCPSLPAVFPAGMKAEPLRPGQVTIAQPLRGTTVTLFAGLDTAAKFREELAQFTARTGINIRLVGNPAIPDYLETTVASGDPPDLAFFGAPVESVLRFASEGGIQADTRKPVRRLVDLATYLDIEQLKADQSPYLVSLGTVGPDGSWPAAEGATFSAFVNVDVKSLIWYPMPEFEAAGYSIPKTWDDLIELSHRMVADGRTPWCLGWGAGYASGWPGTDWVENLLLASEGPAAYDRWTFHEIPFESAPVRTAFHRLGAVLFTDGFVDGGPKAAARRPFEDAQTPMVSNEPPGCWLHQFPGFAVGFVPPGSLGRRMGVFPFPALNTSSVGGMLGGGLEVGAFSDRPEVREVVRFLLGPEFGKSLVTVSGHMSPNRRFDTANYAPAWRPTAEALKAALAADTFRFDASDLMPPEVGGDAFWKGMMTYAKEGPGSLDRILRDIDDAWPDDG
jgi:serine/threonine protein kinase/ABC-type glycerol-3-phosphate transport system substrate-binding protein